MGLINDLIGKVAESVLGERLGRRGTTFNGRSVRPASEDPYGDPADQMRRGQPNLGRFGRVRPASEDPLGDPADQMPRRHR